MSNPPTAGFDVRIRGIGTRQAKAIDLKGSAILAKVVPQTGKKGPSLVVWSRKCARQTGNLFQVLVEQMQSLIRLGGIRIGMGVVSHWQPPAHLSDLSVARATFIRPVYNYLPERGEQGGLLFH